MTVDKKTKVFIMNERQGQANINRKIKISKSDSISVEEYIGDTLRMANDFSETAVRLIKFVKTLDDVYVLSSAGFLAAHAAELYLKALIVGYEGQTGYGKARNVKPSHDLMKLLNILIENNQEIISLERILQDLNKYSGDKMRYIEKQYINQGCRCIDYGSDEILKIQQIKNFVKKSFDI
jgi:HEPN domain-containing protein